MKKRIQTDSAILSLVVIVAAFICQFHYRHQPNPLLDNLMDFFGIMLIFHGIFIRMAARGHKKVHSGEGKKLVMTGPYSLVRNPMYLGTFFMGCGFVLTLWPWWILPVFALLFYLRFKRQVAIEEEHLKKMFGDRFESYVRSVPAVFPSWDKLRKVKVKQTFPWAEAWNTKEKRNLITWPLVAVVLEIVKDKFFFGHADLQETIFIYLIAGIVFTAGMWWEYSRA